MNATENPAVQSYLKKVSSLLECPRQRKKEILRGIELLIGEHLHPDGSVRYEEIVAAIGTPEEVVEPETQKALLDCRYPHRRFAGRDGRPVRV